MKAKVGKIILLIFGSFILKFESYLSLFNQMQNNMKIFDSHITVLELVETLLISIAFFIVFYKLFEIFDKFKLFKLFMQERTKILIDRYFVIDSIDGAIYKPGEYLQKEKERVKDSLQKMMPNKTIKEIDQLISEIYEFDRDKQ